MISSCVILSTRSKVFYTFFFCEPRRNPGFSFGAGESFRKKSRVSSPGKYRKLMVRYLLYCNNGNYFIPL
ncbi:Uncharacterized protein dnm_070660 [Desulfonema magnum]|uniref:Uncharacterized protein n=1 Tax=Desulfonema magnum TaxID=45655 RepID=A0A975GRJ8_9BACT|nr:Uncharacterized protein dnm_070660 [Desulfonema magnum]